SYIKNVKHCSRCILSISRCGIKFFFEHTLHRDLSTLNFIRPPREKKLPVVLSPEEVRRILRLVRLQSYRTCLTTIYSCGLRLQEGTHLQVQDIDGSRKMIHVRQGKGAKDRCGSSSPTNLGIAATVLGYSPQSTSHFPF